MFELGYPEYRVNQHTDSSGTLLRRVEITPKLSMPAAVQRVLGDVFSYVESGELRSEVYRFKLLPASGHPADLATSEGSMRAEATPEGWTNRIIELSIDVRAFGLGRMLENFAAKAAQEAYATHARSVNLALASGQR